VDGCGEDVGRTALDPVAASSEPATATAMVLRIRMTPSARSVRYSTESVPSMPAWRCPATEQKKT
jgi:hypothetical protein